MTSKGWPENRWPTTEELALYLCEATEQERLEFAGKAIRNAQDANQCFLENHKALLEQKKQSCQRTHLVPYLTRVGRHGESGDD